MNVNAGETVRIGKGRLDWTVESTNGNTATLVSGSRSRTVLLATVTLTKVV